MKNSNLENAFHGGLVLISLARDVEQRLEEVRLVRRP